MLEQNLYFEIPGRQNSFHSAVLTSFSFDFHYFEHQVLSVLKKKWITNIITLVDQNILEGLLGKLTLDLKHTSQSYILNGVKSTGAFHPKINFFIGENKALLLIGSGNITPGGHGKNHEIFTGFYADEKNKFQLPLIQECWDYLINITNRLAGFSAKRIRNVIPNNTEILNKTSYQKHEFNSLKNRIEAAMLYNDENSIFEQLIHLIPKNRIKKVTIVSPYFDENGEVLNHLSEHFNKANIEVYLTQNCSLPPTKINKNKQISFFNWDNTTRGKIELTNKINYVRKLHSKIFHFESDNNEYCLIGSANATIAGIGSSKTKAINDEFCVLYRLPKGNLLKTLGISGFKEEIDPTKLTRTTVITEETLPKSKIRNDIFIIGCDLEGLNLTIFTKEPIKLKNNKVILYNNQAEIIFSKEIDSRNQNYIIITLDKLCLKNNPRYVNFENDIDEIISNKQVINLVDSLRNSDPSKQNRTITQIINALEVREANEFAILDYINEIHYTAAKEKEQRHRTDYRISRNVNKHHRELTYEEAVEESKNYDIRDHIYRTHNSIRFWDAISKQFNDSLIKNEEEKGDEEESATPETSKERNENTNIKIISNKKETDSIITKLIKLTNNYLNSLNKLRNDREHVIGYIDLCQYLIISYLLNNICFISKYEMNNSMDEATWMQKLKSKYGLLMLDILNDFSKFIIQHKLEKNIEDTDKERFNKYLKDAIYYSMINIYLTDSNTPRSVSNNIEIIALNIFEYIGEPDSSIHKFIDSISKTNEEVFFSAYLCNEMIDNYYQLYFNINENEKYFRMKNSGFCYIYEKDEHEIKYRSVYGNGHITLEQFKKNQKGL